MRRNQRHIPAGVVAGDGGLLMGATINRRDRPMANSDAVEKIAGSACIASDTNRSPVTPSARRCVFSSSVLEYFQLFSFGVQPLDRDASYSHALVH